MGARALPWWEVLRLRHAHLHLLSIDEARALLELEARIVAGMYADDRDTPDVRRLRFYRWMVNTGRLSDGLPLAELLEVEHGAR